MATKEEREFKKHLTELSRAILILLARLDVLMKQPVSVERGKAIAQVCNDMDMVNDHALHFGLGMSFKRIERLKKLAEKVAVTGQL